MNTHAAVIKVKPSLVPDTFDVVNGYHIEDVVDHLRSKKILGWSSV